MIMKEPNINSIDNDDFTSQKKEKKKKKSQLYMKCAYSFSHSYYFIHILPIC